MKQFLRIFAVFFTLSAALLVFGLSANAADKGKISVFAAATSLNEIFGEFTKDTGIRVEYLEMSSGEVLTRLRAAKGKPQADVWFGGGLDSYIAAAGEGFLAAYQSPERTKIPARYVDKEGYWTGMSMNVVEIMVNKDTMAQKKLPMPTSWADLAKPIYKGEVLMATPAVSGTFYFMVAEILAQFGKDDGWKLLTAIDANVPYYAKRGAEPANKVATGEAAIAVAPFDTGMKLRKEGYPLQAVLPTDGTPWYFSSVAIFSNAVNMDGSKALVDWILSERGQKVIADNSPPAPVRENIPLPENMIIIKDARLVDCDMVTIGNERKAILEEWQKRFGSK